jgi:hypothetical protein
MTAAAPRACCLAEYLRTEPASCRPATAFFDLEQIVVDAAWMISAGGDAARLDARSGAQVPEDVSRQRWALGQPIRASPVDQVVARAVNDVQFMSPTPTRSPAPLSLTGPSRPTGVTRIDDLRRPAASRAS